MLVAAPSAPTNIQGMPQPTSVMLSWTQSNLDVVDNYIINYRRVTGCSEAPSGTRTISDGSLRNYNLMGLEENIEYEIIITAMNAGGMSSAMKMLMTQTAGKYYFY